MEQLSPALAPRTVQSVALAYFSHASGVSDSVRDLCTAGFLPAQISISHRAAPHGAHTPSAQSVVMPNAVGKHSRLWLWKRAFAHDWGRKGADQLSGLNPVPPEGANPTCLALDLQRALAAMSVPAVVIDLLMADVQQQGSFVMVDADDRVQQAERILSSNAGYVRTKYFE